MKQSLAHIALLVSDYDQAIEYFTTKLHFELLEDTHQPEQGKRWVLVAPPNSKGATLLLARATTPAEQAAIGNQSGGRVFLFLHTDDVYRDYLRMQSDGIPFVRPPHEEPYGTVAVFRDHFGNLWDLLQPKNDDV